MVKPIEERIEQLRTQLELWNENLTIQLKQEKDKYPDNLNLIVQAATAVFQFATTLDREEKKAKGVVESPS